MVACTHLCPRMLTIGSAFYELKAALLALYDEGEAAAIAHEILQHATGLDKLSRLSQKQQLLSEPQVEQFRRMKEQLLASKPLQYVLGEAYFMGRCFRVTPAVLIPRPETEELVQWIIDDGKSGSILDIGAGSGCIPISLKLALEDCQVSAIEISEEALDVARSNAKLLGAEVAFQQTDFLNADESGKLSCFDVIVSNPPYIPITEAETLHANVREHEPAAALFVPGNDALLFYRAIAEFGRKHLAHGGAIYSELHRDYAEATVALFEANGYRDVVLRKDMHSNQRMLRAMW